ncbi:unnamed protein product [Enterobius vermicularis]|uniref:C2H2-type domain-containing protein n=1 Tax=Enterobius vermicularis TaxID=51028 RepID=A0A0N4V5M8_ENTVE|nr:unnamed protein product [Enterobius vermicularis]
MFCGLPAYTLPISSHYCSAVFTDSTLSHRLKIHHYHHLTTSILSNYIVLKYSQSDGNDGGGTDGADDDGDDGDVMSVSTVAVRKVDERLKRLVILGVWIKVMYLETQTFTEESW